MPGVFVAAAVDPGETTLVKLSGWSGLPGGDAVLVPAPLPAPDSVHSDVGTAVGVVRVPVLTPPEPDSEQGAVVLDDAAAAVPELYGLQPLQGPPGV
ncbi:0fdf7e1b-5f61-45e0-b841-0fd15e538c66 [Thermothielavioides terrestris]|uniref:0fdf7e1b-5f61-45e0-b841-0fd15e538c66 n=1 Tax=Thermothielavioides terrestris TaxID=2587410 RepID=A0A3S4AS79_9PEZI|nr:0fdf7e1b-5f61-45e0-b841-0fd15e538c66 [Thermothielavioides terrestris]